MSTEQSPEEDAIRVTCTDLKTGDSEAQDMWDDYCLITAGSAEMTDVQVYRKSDGTVTHVITVKGVRRG